MNQMPPLKSLFRLALETLSAPRKSLREVLSWNLSTEQLFLAGFVILALGVILPVLASMVVTLGQEVEGLPLTVFQQFAIQVVIFLTTIVLFHWLGRMFRGRGHWSDALVSVVWLNFILVLLTVLQSLLLVLSPFLAQAMILASLLLFFYLLVQFAMEVHGFASAPMVFLGVIGGTILLSMVLFISLGWIGVNPQELLS